MRVTQIKYISELWDVITGLKGTTTFSIPRKPEQPLPTVRDLLHFGSARKWMVTQIEQHEETLWVWLGTPK